MIDGLLIALVIKIGSSEMVMRNNQSKLRFAMRVNQDLPYTIFYFAEGKLVHP